MAVINEIDPRNNEGRSPEFDPEVVLNHNGLELISGTANTILARNIGDILKKEVDEPVTLFDDKEIKVKLTHFLRRKDIFIIQPTSPPVNDHIMQLCLMIDAAKRSSAGEITAIIPYYGYSRQDRKSEPKVPITAALIANMLETAGADRILTVDIHATQEQGFARIPWDNLYASASLVPAMKKHKVNDPVFVSPDLGGSQRANAYAQFFDVKDFAAIYKQHENSGETHSLFLAGDVEGRDVWIVDDILGRGTTIFDAAELVKEKGANKVFAAVAHGLFLNNSLEKLQASPIEKLLVTDSIDHKFNPDENPKIEVVSIAPLLAKAIQYIHTGQELHDLFI